MSIIQGTSKAAGGAGYEIDQSIRFDSVRNSDLTRTLSGDGNLKTGTFSFWMKRSGLGSLQEIFTTYSIRSTFFFNSNDTLAMQIYNGASYTTLTTTAVFRDPSAFAHYLFRWDTTQATDTDRLQFYYNGVLQTVTGAYPAQNSTTTFSDATYTHVISGDGSANTLYEIDGYLAEIHYVDGTALAATDFGEYNANGVWVPIEYTGGSYGNNGFYITGATASDLGEDFSGNNNDYTSSGLATTDQMLDTPTDNYCVMNPLDAPTGSITLANGNLDLNQSSFNKVRGTIAFDVQDDDGFYFEVKKTNGNFRSAGIVSTDASNFASAQSLLSVNPSVVYYMEGGEVNQNGSQILASLPTFATNDVLGIAVRNGKVYFAKNNTWVNSGDPVNETGQVASITGSSPLYSPAVGEQNNQSGITNTVNFGATAFAYTPPTGYKKINTANLATPSITDGSAYFQTSLWNGNGSTQTITQSGNSTFEPGMIWSKGRNNVQEHVIFDQVRGTTKYIQTDNTGAEGTQSGVTAFNSDGFDLGSWAVANGSGQTHVGWQWKANGTGSSNTDGSITSTVSANTTSAFSIVSYVGNSTSGATVGHGLGAVPKMMILKDRDVAENWVIYNEVIGPTKFMYFTTDAAFTASNRWNDTAPTSSVFTLGNETQVNATGRDYVVYCFAEIPGYSSIGSYTGNGSTDGPFIYTGFAPEFIMVKSSSNSGTNWDILDATRETFNTRGNQLFANSSAAEASNDHECDFLSNGFKWRDGSGSNNGSGYTIIYMAFAKHPFGGDGVAPATAR